MINTKERNLVAFYKLEKKETTKANKTSDFFYKIE
jgi:hypothetical protein